MDWMKQKTLVKEFLRKNYPVMIAVAAGIVLLMMPQKPQERAAQESPAPPPTVTLEERLEETLRCVSGAGRVEVLLTLLQGEQTFYQTDGAADRRSTVLITGQSREESGLVSRVDAPKYRGAVVVCQGADNAGVRLAIVQAVAAVTGLSTEKITVLKMK